MKPQIVNRQDRLTVTANYFRHVVPILKEYTDEKTSTVICCTTAIICEAAFTLGVLAAISCAGLFGLTFFAIGVLVTLFLALVGGYLATQYDDERIRIEYVQSDGRNDSGV